MTNDFCFVDVMETAILKCLQAWRRFLSFFMTHREAFIGRHMVFRSFKQHYLINHLIYWGKFARRNQIQIDPNI